jgi:transposase
MLLADRGYDADWIRELARQQGAWANVPPKRNRKNAICFSPSGTDSGTCGLRRADIAIVWDDGLVNENGVRVQVGDMGMHQRRAVVMAGFDEPIVSVAR